MALTESVLGMSGVRPDNTKPERFWLLKFQSRILRTTTKLKSPLGCVRKVLKRRFGKAKTSEEADWARSRVDWLPVSFPTRSRPTWLAIEPVFKAALVNSDAFRTEPRAYSDGLDHWAHSRPRLFSPAVDLKRQPTVPMMLKQVSKRRNGIKPAIGRG